MKSCTQPSAPENSTDRPAHRRDKQGLTSLPSLPGEMPPWRARARKRQGQRQRQTDRHRGSRSGDRVERVQIALSFGQSRPWNDSSSILASFTIRKKKKESRKARSTRKHESRFLDWGQKMELLRGRDKERAVKRSEKCGWWFRVRYQQCLSFTFPVPEAIKDDLSPKSPKSPFLFQRLAAVVHCGQCPRGA